MKHLFNHLPFALPASALLVCTGMLTLVGNTSAQQDSSAQEALREASIMRSIFAAALEENDNRGRMRFGQPESLYLAGQGMVFTFNLPGELNTILFNGLDPVAAIEFSRSGRDGFDRTFSFDLDDDDRSRRIAGLLNGESASPLQQQLQETLETMRDKQEEMNRLQRELRNLRRLAGDPGNTGNTGNTGNIESPDTVSETAQLEEAIEKLNADLHADSENYRQAMNEFQAERNAALDARRQAQADMIFTTLCEYGKTLDSLQADEYINLVMRNFDDDDTRVFVVDFAAVTSCTSAQSLRESAASYSL